MMSETSDLIEKCSSGSLPSEAHRSGWEGLGWDGGEPAAVSDDSLLIICHRDRDAS